MLSDEAGDGVDDVRAQARKDDAVARSREDAAVQVRILIDMAQELDERQRRLARREFQLLEVGARSRRH